MGPCQGPASEDGIGSKKLLEIKVAKWSKIKEKLDQAEDAYQRVLAADPDADDSTLVADPASRMAGGVETSTITVVAIDEQGRPAAVPPLDLETEEERARALRAAERRRLTQENTALRRMVAQRGQPPLGLDQEGVAVADGVPVVGAEQEHPHRLALDLAAEDQPGDRRRPRHVQRVRLGPAGKRRILLGPEILNDHLLNVAVFEVHRADGERAGARQLARLGQGSVPCRGARFKVLSDLVSDAFEFVHCYQYSPVGGRGGRLLAGIGGWVGTEKMLGQ
mgnify:CR=1 FL=1